MPAEILLKNASGQTLMVDVEMWRGEAECTCKSCQNKFFLHWPSGRDAVELGLAVLTEAIMEHARGHIGPVEKVSCTVA